jgi:hypothetical protein
MRTRFVWPYLAAVMVVACGESTAPVVEGSFEASVTGEFSLEMDGTAEFGIFSGEGFGMSLVARDGTQTLGFGRRAESRPAVSTYVIEEPDSQTEIFALYLRQGPEGLGTFLSRSGEVVITASSATRLEGTFSLRARGFITGQPSEREVVIEGAFSASCARTATRCE